MNDEQVAHLLQLYFTGSISAEQQNALAEWIQEHGHSATFETLMQQSWQQFQTEQQVDGDRADKWLQHIVTGTHEAAVVPMAGRSRRVWMRWAAAAAVLVFVVCSFWFVVGRRSGKKPPVAETPAVHDVPPPAVSKAVLTLANGQQIVLDSAANGSLAVQGTTNVVKLKDGELSYSRESGVGSREPIQYNTLTVPAGSRITGITLSDGTRVLLNAASGITYPVAFTGAERKVGITGEVYFEVAKDKAKPFMVDVNGRSTVEVLGTHFNINAYDDEESIKTTLLEGKVRMKSEVGSLKSDENTQTSDLRPQTSVILTPGQQGELSPTNGLKIQHGIDINQVISWKNGMFLYKGTDIKTIMREVARTYNVNIQYESVSKEKFYAEVARNTNISSLLKMLELTGEVHFKVEGNQVTVLK